MMHQSGRYLNSLTYVVGIVLWVPSAMATDAHPPATQPAVGTQPAGASRPTLAVLDFAIGGKVDATGSKVIAASVRREFIASNRYDLMDRDMMRERMTEKDFAATVECDQVKCLLKYGKSLAVEKIVGGEVNSFGESWTVAIHLVDVNTGHEEQYVFRKFTGKMDDIVDVAADGARELMGLAPNSSKATSRRSATGDRPKTMTLDLGNGLNVKLVQIPAGTFLMGSPETERDRNKLEVQHEVTISKPFYLSVYEVTVGQYAQFLKDTGHKHEEPSFKQTGDHPVVNVTWDDAQAFCKWFSKKTGRTVVLPTEAQWEYACRAGTKMRFSFGDKDDELCKYGNYCDKSNTNGVKWQDKEHNDGFDKTAPVGSLKPNAWGLYDMHGNVWEWCSDWYADGYAATDKTDPTGPASGTCRVLRGGSWLNEAFRCRVAHRGDVYPDARNLGYGFRLAVDSE